MIFSIILLVTVICSYASALADDTTSPKNVNFADKPTFKCQLNERRICQFYNIHLNTTYFNWQPTADDPSTVRFIEFTESTIPVMTKDICETFPVLTFLDLYNVGIREITQGAFDSCSELSNLMLQRNLLKRIPSRAFEKLTNLLMLNLKDNQLEQLDPGCFSKLSRLMFLDVAGNNLIDFSPQLVQQNTELTYLYVDSNYLSDVAVEKLVELLPIVQRIEFDDNAIRCSRVAEMNEFLIAEKISFIPRRQFFYDQYRHRTEFVYRGFSCKPDAVWYFSKYRMHYSKSVNDDAACTGCRCFQPRPFWRDGR